MSNAEELKAKVEALAEKLDADVHKLWAEFEQFVESAISAKADEADPKTGDGTQTDVVAGKSDAAAGTGEASSGDVGTASEAQTGAESGADAVSGAVSDTAGEKGSD